MPTQKTMPALSPIIAIDGPSASGKGTIAQLVADRLGFHYLDSGALYRVVAFATHQHHIAWSDAIAVAKHATTLKIQFKDSQIYLNHLDITDDIRSEAMGKGASQVAVHAPLRAVLVDLQHSFLKLPGLVADGRDMGTVVFPEAPLKIFLTASAEERARRRYLQLKGKVDGVSLSSLLDEIRARDERDTQRAVAPLKPAADAIQLDSTELSIEQVLERILSEIALRDIAG